LKLIEETRLQLETVGYSGVTIRSVAKACGVGVGTVYNYFPSKEALIATHLLKDWKDCMNAIEKASDSAETPKPVLRCMYTQLVEFAGRHESVFRDEAAASGFAGSFRQYHSLLRSQLAQPLCKFCVSDFSAQFIAESLLTWSMTGKSFDEVYEILQKLF
jgi:AcrR family transcriptional regulator